MANDKDVYIGSISPTIGKEQLKGLIQVGHNVNPLLTIPEWLEIMNVYDKAITRIFKENNIDIEED